MCRVPTKSYVEYILASGAALLNSHPSQTSLSELLCSIMLQFMQGLLLYLFVFELSTAVALQLLIISSKQTEGSAVNSALETLMLSCMLKL